MSTYGLTAAGFVPKPVDVIKAEIEAFLLGNVLGQSAGTEPDGSIPPRSVAGQIVGFLVDREAGFWDQAQALASAYDPTQAVGASLDALGALSGVRRAGQAYSTATCTCCGTPGTPLLAGRAATVSVVGTRFASVADGTIASLTAWAQSTAYLVGDRRTANGKAYRCTVAGTSSNSGTGPSTTSSAITDGTATWQYLGVGTGAVDLTFRCAVIGPFGALAGTLSTIATPVSGWQSVTNLADAQLGAYTEGDTLYRIRREAEVSATGHATAEAVRAHLLEVGAGTSNAVKACTVFFNDTDATDANGLPPHAVEVLVVGGADADVAAAVWLAVGAGIRQEGTTTTTITDSQGKVQTIRFTRPSAVPIYVTAAVTYDQTAGAFPSDGATQIAGALVTLGASYAVGRSVYASVLSATVVDGPVSSLPGALPCPGVLDVSSLHLGTSASPSTSTPVTIGSRQIATFDSSHVVVNLTPGTP